MSPSALYLSAVLAIGNRLPTDADARQALAERYAAEIDAAVGADTELILMTIATIGGESGFDSDIAACNCVSRHECDRDHRGRITAFGLPQIHAHLFRGHDATEVCASTMLQFTLAAAELHRLRQRFGAEGALRWFIGCPATDKRFTWRLGFFRRWLREWKGNSK